MERIPAELRPKEAWHDGHLTYDVHDAWPDNDVLNGVKRSSWLLVYRQAPGSKPARIHVWVPDSDPFDPVPKWQEHDATLTWGQRGWFVVPKFGVASVTSLDDVPLKVFNVVTPGKA